LNTGTDISLRPIIATDDAAMASVIRTVIPEFGAAGHFACDRYYALDL
jgi:hypothetical protein